MLAKTTSLRALSAAAMLVFASVLGCNQSGSSDAASPLNMVDTDDVNIRVESGGAPLARAVIKIVSVSPELNGVPLRAPELLFKGQTNEAGRLQGRFPRPSAIERVDVLVMKPGYVGPYTEPSRRLERPEFGPASWQTVPTSDVADMTIALIKETN